MTYDDPFIVRMNILHLQSLLSAEIDEAKRGAVRQILNEFEEVAALGSSCTLQPNPL